MSLTLIQSSSNLGTMILRYWGLLLHEFFKNSHLFFRFIQDFVDHYVWVDVRSMMYMSSEDSFIVWVDWNVGSMSRLGRPIILLNARFDNQIAFA